MNATFNKLAGQEETFFKSTFLAPVLRGRPIFVRIANVVCQMSVRKDFEGWGIFRPKNAKFATFVRLANMIERKAYMDLFPTLRLILCRKSGDQWYGINANENDKRFKITGLVPVRFPREVQMFDTVLVRFDGEQCWFDELSVNQLREAVWLRDALYSEYEPRVIKFSNKVGYEQNQAFQIAYDDVLATQESLKRAQHAERLKTTEGKIKDALTRAGASYRSHVEIDDGYTIEFAVGGEFHRSVVDKELGVRSAGICLSGGDKLFDLGSVVGVILEGQERHAIVRVGENTEDDWDD